MYVLETCELWKEQMKLVLFIRARYILASRAKSLPGTNRIHILQGNVLLKRAFIKVAPREIIYWTDNGGIRILKNSEKHRGFMFRALRRISVKYDLRTSVKTRYWGNIDLKRSDGKKKWSTFASHTNKSDDERSLRRDTSLPDVAEDSLDGYRSDLPKFVVQANVSFFGFI